VLAPLTAPGTPGRKRRMPADFVLTQLRRNAFGLLFIGPALVVFIVFRAWPLAQAFGLSFCKVNPIGDSVFTGLRNYSDLWASVTFRQSVQVTVLFTVLTTPLMLAWALLLALCVSHERVRGATFFKATLFMPMITSWVVVSIVFKWLLNTKYGMVNTTLEAVGLPTPNWLADPNLALLAIVAITLWKLGGLFMLIFAANLQIIDRSLNEAASIDGASPLQRFRYITLNQLRPSFFVATILGIIFFFRTFTVIFAMTGGDPGGTTNLLAYEIYNLAFRDFNFGRAFAGTLFLFAVVAVASTIQTLLSRED
jgi:multiple sugar transport system permease protein